MKKLLLLLLIALLLTGCTPASREPNRFQVVASFYPVWVLTANVVDGIDSFSLSCMTQADTGCLHHYQLSTSDMKALENADALILGGADMEHFIEQVASQFPDLSMIDSSEDLTYLIQDGEETNPHVWLDVDNAMSMVRAIARELAVACPEAAAQLQSNAEAYCVKLQSLKEELETTLSSCSHRQWITSHDAFHYFAREFDFTIAGVVAGDEESEPSAAHISELMTLVKTAGIPALIVEPDTRSAAVNTLSAETGVKTVVLNPITTGAWALTAYEDTLRENARVLAEAFQ